MRSLPTLILLGLTVEAHALDLIIDGGCPTADIEIERGTPGAQVALVWSNDWDGTTPVPAGVCAGTPMDLNGLNLATILTLDSGGDVRINPTVPVALCDTANLQAIELGTCDTSPVAAFRPQSEAFPSADSTVEWGSASGLLGSSPSAAFSQAGDRIHEAFKLAPYTWTSFGYVSLTFDIQDNTGACAGGGGPSDIDLDIVVEGVTVDSFRFQRGTGGTIPVTLDRALISPIPVTGDLDIEIVAANDVCPGGGAYRILPGGFLRI